MYAVVRYALYALSTVFLVLAFGWVFFTEYLTQNGTVWHWWMWLFIFFAAAFTVTGRYLLAIACQGSVHRSSDEPGSGAEA